MILHKPGYTQSFSLIDKTNREHWNGSQQSEMIFPFIDFPLFPPLSFLCLWYVPLKFNIKAQYKYLSQEIKESEFFFCFYM